MPDNPPAAAAYWDDTLLELPTPTRLYCLEPCGRGTPDVESFTSYLTRLAAAHCVTPRRLVAQEIAPLMGSTYSKKAVESKTSNTWGRSDLLNGIAPSTRIWITTVEALTGQQGLCYLTMLPLTAILSGISLMRPWKAWCPSCLHNWREANRPIYEPLRWALQGIKWCPYHALPLQDTCARCGKRLPPLDHHSYPGMCSACGARLGDQVADRPASASEQQAIDPQQQWIIATIGQWLAQASHIAPPDVQQALLTRLRMLANRHGGIHPTSRVLQIPYGTVRHWMVSSTSPTLPNLLGLCAATGLSLTAFLQGTEDPAAESVAIPAVWVRQSPVARRQFRSAAIQVALESALSCSDSFPPSLRALGQTLKTQPARLSAEFPVLCQALITRRQQAIAMRSTTRLRQLAERVRQAVFTIHAAGHYPSERRVCLYLAYPVEIRQSIVKAARRAAMNELGYDLPGSPGEALSVYPPTRHDDE